VNFPRRGAPECWRLDHALPDDVRILAQKNYQIWSANAFHPSLHFKPIGKPNWSVRVGAHYRAVGKFFGGVFLWEWIGTHEDYNHRF
jgi:hypothetical protein